MTELVLEKDLRLALKAQAHPLNPVVLLGTAGLTDSVVAEVDRALMAHSLIKVRVPLDDRSERDAVFAALADRVGAARVQSIGKLIVLYRPPPPEAKAEAAEPTRTRSKRAPSRRGDEPVRRGRQR